MTNRTEHKFGVSPAVVLVVLVIVYFFALLRSDWVNYQGLSESRTKLKEDVSRLTELRAKLRREISSLDDPEYIELLAREKLGLIKPGEVPYKVVR